MAGFPDLICPLCGDKDNVQSLQLNDLETIVCSACEETYSVTDVRKIVNSWQSFLNWLDAKPPQQRQEY